MKDFLQIIVFGLLLALLSFVQDVQAVPSDTANEELLTDKILYETDSFYDIKVDYSKLSGRVTDRDPTNNIMKVSSENLNAKFFKAGDYLEFTTAKDKMTDPCKGYIRSVEPGYFVMYVSDLDPCWKMGTYFRRGTLIAIESKKLAQRVKDAAIYRLVLLKRRKDYFNQLNGINHFLWSFGQEKVLVAAEYDKKILELQKKKQKALENLSSKRRDKMVLQKELIKQLDVLDRDLDHYRIEKNELYVDRWHMDHDLGHPVGKRPQDLKPLDESIKNEF